MKKVQQFFKSKYFISSFAGALCALAFAPFYLIIFAPISLSVFYFLLEKEKNNKPIFFLGFTYGFGYFLAGNYWIAISLLVDAHSFAWLIPFALTLIPSALALYLALLALSYKKIISRFHFHKNYQKILIFAILWIIFEALRSHLFTGFPWNLLGYIWMIDEVLAQSANVFSIYGLSFLAVLISLLPILFLKNHNKKDDKIFATIITLLFIANLTYGKIYIDDDKLVINEESKIRLVQANIKQEMKWDEREKYKNFLKTINLTNYASLDGIKMVIWSETSLP
jgi:apolipoprotein N-acyltransferase